MKSILSILLVCISLLTHAQEPFDSAQEDKGIKWTTGMKWGEILEKAKKENKYIFLDCFTTWCGPCKWMDKDVYTNDTVGQLFNKKFISVKLQMDQTKYDDTAVQRLYSLASSFAITYFIYSYPTYLFMSPEGKPVHKETGYKAPAMFMALAAKALEPGRAYIDPAAECARLVEQWEKQDNKDYDQLPRLIQTARAAYNIDAEMTLLKELGQYMASLPKEERYSKERVEIWKDVAFASTSKTFAFFLQDGKAIDNVVDEKGFSERIVDKAIFNEISQPFLEAQNKNKRLAMSGMNIGGPGAEKLKEQLKDYSEADWEQLQKNIKKKFGKKIAKRNVLSARVEWYSRHFNQYKFVKYSLEKFNKYPVPVKQSADAINDFAWPAFINITDKKLLNAVIKTAGRVAKEAPINDYFLDTYANLLYKVGKRKEAILWEEKQLAFVSKFSDKEWARERVKEYTKTLDQMKAGRPTNDVRPLWLINEKKAF